MDDDRRKDLEKRLITRRKYDEKWAATNFVFFQTFLAISIIASFATAIIAASNIASPIVLAVLASIPGTAIFIDKSFRFADRWRWHCLVGTRFASLEQRLVLEGASVEEVSKTMSEYLFDMEQKYPAYSRAVFHEPSEPAHKLH